MPSDHMPEGITGPLAQRLVENSAYLEEGSGQSSTPNEPTRSSNDRSTVTKEMMATVMEEVFNRCKVFRQAGQKEYAHKDDNAFANFERVSERLGVDRMQVLMVYLEKHMDGIHSYIQGHRSQREDVVGRIGDVIVYLCLLEGMIRQDRGDLPNA